MNKKIFENARFCPKGGTEADWNKAVGFIPLDKEIIIYKPDETHSAARFKVGDGKTAVQDLPFSGTDIEAIERLIDEKGELLIKYIDNTVAAIEIPQSDWNQTDENAKDFIKNKPTIPVIPAGLATEEYVDNAIAGINPQIQSDYNQNDNTAADYIKNRPFYETDSLIDGWNEDTALDQISITARNSVGSRGTILSYRKVSNAYISSVDDFYSMKLNNDKIDSTKVNNDYGSDCFGYVSLTGKVKISIYSGKVEAPYLIVVNKKGCYISKCVSTSLTTGFKDFSANKTASVGIYILQNANSFANFNEYDSASLYGKLVVPIDMKYLPSDIITKTDVGLLEQKNDEQDTKIAAIENKIIIATKDNILSIFN